MIYFRLRDMGNGVIRVLRTDMSPGDSMGSVLLPGEGVPVDFSSPEMGDALQAALSFSPVGMVTPFVGRAIQDDGGLLLQATPLAPVLLPEPDLLIDGLPHGVRGRMIVDPVG